jgi:glyoxylase-like metal-dependent hydrolase (beta-lactamase superfamily II)
MLIQCFVGGPVETNGYLVADQQDGESLVIDAPQNTAAAMHAQAGRWRAPVRLLVNTHAHWDHFLDNAPLLRLTGAKFAIHKLDAPLLNFPQARMFGVELEVEPTKPDFFLEEGKQLVIGKLKFEILHCPGHSPGSVVLFERAAKAAFVGDVLFAGSIGRTDLPAGNHEALLRSIREKLLPLDDDVRVFSGHGEPTTIGVERRTNPFLAG